MRAGTLTCLMPLGNVSNVIRQQLREAAMRHTLRTEVDIAATPDEVWRCLTNFADYPRGVPWHAGPAWS